MSKNLSFYILLSIFFGLVLYGCRSQVPKPTSYEFSMQQKMQAAHHWDILAEDAAKQIKSKLSQMPEYKNIPLYVEKNKDIPFTRAFSDLLCSHLLESGLKVTENKHNAIHVNNKVQVIHHNASRTQRPWPGAFTSTASVIAGGVAVARNISHSATGAAAAGGGILAGAAIDSAFGYHVSLSENEVLITTSLTHNKNLVLNKTDIYYINDADYGHYQEKARIKNKTYSISK